MCSCLCVCLCVCVFAFVKVPAGERIGGPYLPVNIIAFNLGWQQR